MPKLPLKTEQSIRSENSEVFLILQSRFELSQKSAKSVTFSENSESWTERKERAFSYEGLQEYT